MGVDRDRWVLCVSVWLSEDQADALDDIATRSGISKADIMRRGLDLAIPETEAWLKKHPDPKKRGKKKR